MRCKIIFIPNLVFGSSILRILFHNHKTWFWFFLQCESDVSVGDCDDEDDGEGVGDVAGVDDVVMLVAGESQSARTRA